MNTPPLSILLFVIASLLGAVGQFLYKSGAEQIDGSAESIFVNARIWGGVVCYIAVMVLLLSAFQRGGSLSVLYPHLRNHLYLGGHHLAHSLRNTNQANSHSGHGFIACWYVAHGETK